MTRLIFLFAFVLLQNHSFGQAEFSPPGAEWCYTFYGGFAPSEGYLKVRYDRDTMIESKPCKILEMTQVFSFFGNCCDTLNLGMVIYQSGDSVYHFTTYTDDFEFLFRNQMPLNEALVFPYLFPDNLKVIDINTVSPNNVPIEVFTLKSTGGFSFETDLYDRAGPELGFFFNWFGAASDGFDYQLIWYADDEIPDGFQIVDEPCDDLFTANEEVADETKFSLFPNPVENMLQVKLPVEFNENMEWRIIDVSGKTVLIKEAAFFDTQLDVSGLSPGLYFLTLELDGKLYRTKFVKG